MSKRDGKSNSKEKFIKFKSPLYFPPHSSKNNSKITNIYTEQKKIYQNTDYNLSKNKIKQKINVKNFNKNELNIRLPEPFKKSSRVPSSKPSVEKNSTSHKKSNSNSKIFLKNNMVKNISALNYTDADINITGKEGNFTQNKLDNIKFNIGKSSQNFLNSQISKANLKKNAESAYELLDNNNYLRKSKVKPKKISNMNNINPIGFMYNSGKDKKDEPISPSPEIIFLKTEKNEEEIKVNPNNKQEENDDGINCLMRNTFTNVKIYPTTILNNKIIYQNDQNNNLHTYQNSNNNCENSNNSSTMRHNNSKIKKEKIIINITDKNQKKEEKKNIQSFEELHYFYVQTLQRGKAFSFKLDN